jgi:archaellum biogenesis protein FlaJ (TadC family)
MAAGLVVAVAGSMTTEFAAVAGIGELYGVSRNLTLPMAASTLLVIILSGSYRRVERTAILIGAFELAFLMVAVRTHPDFTALAHQLRDLPLGRAQIVNAFLLPMVVIFLVILAISVLPQPRRLRGWYLGLVVIAATLTGACGMFGAIHGLVF